MEKGRNIIFIISLLAVPSLGRLGSLDIRTVAVYMACKYVSLKSTVVHCGLQVA